MGRSMLVQEVERGRVYRCPVGVPVLAGRDPNACRIPTRNPHVSRRHCELYATDDDRLRLTDLGSKRGVFVNGARLDERGYAEVGDTVGLGPELELRVLGVLAPEAAPRARDGSLRLPQVLNGRFLLLNLVGQGGSGLVFEAYDEERKQRCALKLLTAGGPASDEVIARFKREALLQNKLGDYPGIVAVRDFARVEPGGELFFVMDFVAGCTLHDLLRGESLPLKEGVRYMARVARAVHYAHERGIVHRDLKPSNVLVSDKGVIRLTDFGVCKALESGDGLTGTGVALGTPNYMAPEQIDDSKRVDERADVYGLGAILYVVLTGTLPFAGETVSEILDLVQEGQLIPPSQFEPTCPPELEAVCVQALQRDPERRQPTALALAKGLEAWLKDADPPTRVKLSLPGS